MDTVTVYFFEHFDDDLNAMQTSKRMATLGTITRIKGVPFMKTGHDVDRSALDGNGFYTPPKG